VSDRSELDPDRLKEYAKAVFGHLEGAMTSAMICLGDRLGLYRAMADGAPVTSEELAASTGLHERWVREWLHAQGAAGMFSSLPDTIAVLDRLPESFRTGVGLDYDAFGPGGARGVERGFAPWFKALLVPLALPRVPGVVETLEKGAQAADVGCGAGVALVEMARAYPRSTFHGYDISSHALERAEENRREAGLENVSFHDARRDPLPQKGEFAFVTTFDCLHDMTDPGRVMEQIRGAISDDGTWLISDIKAKDGYEANVAQNPMAALMYGTSVLSCMSSALSEPGGLGLGTLGFHEDLARQMTAEAGFTSFETLDLGHPVNAFYVVRP
jgi:2-polyprenyl-3-methyl-5-hydroxy-6-metoxy-1,4-benzoquinol methylase